MKHEFFATAFRNKLYTSADQLQADLDEWLLHYNYTRPHLGYRNCSHCPIETVKLFKTTTKEDTSNVNNKMRRKNVSKEG